MSKKYYVIIDSDSAAIYYDTWNNIKNKCQGKRKTIYKSFKKYKDAMDWLIENENSPKVDNGSPWTKWHY